MTRLHTPSSIDASPAPSRPLLEVAQKQIGMVPNLYRVIANSPATLEGTFGFNGALTKGSLDASLHERIALAVAELNSCDYCLSAHTFVAKNVSRLDDEEIARNREGGSKDAKADAAVRFAARVVHTRGEVSDADVEAVKAAGYDDAQIIEIIAHVALNTMTNYICKVGKVEIDTPVVRARKK